MTSPAAGESAAADRGESPPTTTALVTGASSGIGVALAGELARRGHALTLVARRADRLRDMADQIGDEHGVRVEWIAVGPHRRVRRDRIPAEVAARGQVVDVLVNDAGMGTERALPRAPDRAARSR